jgi:Flp pilus assembly protein TadG
MTPRSRVLTHVQGWWLLCRRGSQQPSSGRQCERGGAAVQLAASLVIFVVAILFVAGLARMSTARHKVEGMAADAARAASLERNPAQSGAAAEAAVDRALVDRGMSCSSVSVSTDVSAYEPGGTVSVQVTCVADLGDVAMAGFPGSRTFTADAIVPIETYRGAVG